MSPPHYLSLYRRNPLFTLDLKKEIALILPDIKTYLVSERLKNKKPSKSWN